MDLLSRALNAERPEYFRSYVFEPSKTIETPQCLYAAGPDWEECAAQYRHEVDEERPVALSWHMVTTKRDLLRDAPWTAQNCRARADLLQWWTDGAQAEAVGCERPTMQARLR